MTAVLDERRIGFASKACNDCGHRFFTSLALYEHGLTCKAPEPPRVRRPPTPAQAAAWAVTGLRVAAHNNAARRRCDTCGLASTCAGLGIHQKHTGHLGWTTA